MDTYLGYLVATYGKNASYKIVSNDRGYENVCGFWIDKGYKVTCSSLKLQRTLSISQYQGYTLVRDMSYNESKRCMNIYKNYLNDKNKNKSQFELNLLHSLNKYGYSKKEISRIVDYLCVSKEVLLNGR